MLFLRGIDSKSYWTRLGRGMTIPEVSCPDPSCQGVLGPRGWYRRYLGGKLVSLRRLRCRRCGVSHALLPEDVCAYRDLTLPVLEAAMHSRDGPSAAARAAGQQGPAVRCVRLADGCAARAGSAWVCCCLRPAVSGSASKRSLARFRDS